MKHTALNRIPQLAAIALSLAAVTATAQDPTSAERKQAQRYLTDGRKGVEDAVKGLSEAQWKFKPAPDRWSVAEVVEHLALIEDVVRGILGKIPQAPAPAADRNAKEVDAMLLAKVADRSTKFQAPEGALPTGRWTPTGALEHFVASRAQTAALLDSTPGLRAHTINHPVFGPLDGYQWIIAVAAHTERHTKQILEVKADPNFPAARPASAAAGVN
jgi:hypothetical protein